MSVKCQYLLAALSINSYIYASAGEVIFQGMNFRAIAVLVAVTCMSCHFARGDTMMLFDFMNTRNVDDWSEMSDTVRTVGKSKAVLTLQTSQLFQRAILFTLLNPQPNGAGFAGVRTPTNLDLSKFKNIEITCRGQGQNSNYKISLRHKGQDSNLDLSYEQFFTVPITDNEFSTVTLPLKDFKPYYRGREMPDGEPLDTTNITMFEFQIYGGVYMPIKQRGVSALEIETVAAVST
ncbi:uncharacterized protein LOC116845432 isoform X1 [Odontomachus brunneus]|uniref:uncharacterized protein LOC116845432 isoform X1 n=2 Tax=Odontomachus brunneus TaxID=486640 RepID=UPI0013F18006|nr:uncharacterized protein LOC116845432 isoform X1 [Odontomachus brunneus]